MAAANANYNSNIVGVKRPEASGDDQHEPEVLHSASVLSFFKFKGPVTIKCLA